MIQTKSVTRINRNRKNIRLNRFKLVTKRKNLTSLRCKKLIRTALMKSLAAWANSKKCDTLLIHGMFIFNNMLKNFNLFKNKNLTPSYGMLHFSRFFYKHIRILQSIIKTIRFKLKGLYKFELLKYVTYSKILDIEGRIKLFKPQYLVSKNEYFDKNLKRIIKDSEFDSYLKLKKVVGLSVDFEKGKGYDFNLLLFVLIGRLCLLEPWLQWLNRVLFTNYHKGISWNRRTNFHIGKQLIFFFENIYKYGYEVWHKKQFYRHRDNVSKFKISKRFRFWRDFKRYLLFDKSYILVKFKWLHNHQRVLNQQYNSVYFVNLSSKLKQIYKKKITNSRLLSFLWYLEYRLDILSLHFFKLCSLKWVWILVFFGYITVNLKLHNKFFILQLGDILFGWFLLKNSRFLSKLRRRVRHRRHFYNFLEYEPAINSISCLTPPLKSFIDLNSRSRLVLKKYIKYTFLSIY